MTAAPDRTTVLLDRALDYTIRIRDDNPTVLHAELRALSRADLEATVCVLAALVPDDRTPQQLLAWCEPDWAREASLRAAHAQFTLLRAHQQQIPASVADGERAYQREARRRSRAQARAGAA